MNIRRIIELYDYASNNNCNIKITTYKSAMDGFPRNDKVEINFIDEAFLWDALSLKPELYPYALRDYRGV